MQTRKYGIRAHYLEITQRIAEKKVEKSSDKIRLTLVNLLQFEEKYQ